MREKGRILPADMRLPVAFALICNMITYYGTRLITGGMYHHDLTTPIDERIPVIPWTIVIYWGCYLYWAVNYCIGVRQEKEEAYRFISADFLAKLVGLVIFVAFPTTNTRPVLEGDGLFIRLMEQLYAMDAADNLLPSIHCLTSWFCYIAVRRNQKIPAAYRWFSLAFTILVCISTLTTRQHVLADVAAGIALAEGSYRMVERIGFTGLYRACIRKIRIKGKEGRG